MDSEKHEIAITAIVIRGGKYLITQRSAAKKRFPSMWTVPGGKLEKSDYIDLPKDTKDYWYNVLERTLRREVKEETGIDIENIEYLTSLATIHADGSPSLVISCIADYAGGEVILQPNEADDFKWVALDEAKKYELIDGIFDELVMAEEKQKKRAPTKNEWKRA